MDTRQVTEIYRLLSQHYTPFDQTDDEWTTSGISDTPFKSLVSVALSTMTPSKRTIKAALALYKTVHTFEQLRDIDEQELVERIRSVAHYNRKAKTLKTMAGQIIDKYHGQIPHTQEELMGLSGIGRKCADIMLNFVFEQPTIAVDTHVFRVVNRLGMVSTTTAEATADELTRITPLEFRRHAHEWLIQHGGKVCIARKPHCGECPLTDLCDYYTTQAKHASLIQFINPLIDYQWPNHPCCLS
ncbi:endonuclease III domain-containing protein [Spirosoma flavum]|uniref:Endonuclease III domain-containing protein n=1 Tax=Spirosoma flavum TaxID=2048557 RepID=A0ABW6AIF0_9BACT